MQRHSFREIARVAGAVIVTVALGDLLRAAPRVPQSGRATPPDLTGAWSLNEELSDSAEKALSDTVAQRGRGGRTSDGIGGRRGGFGGRPGGMDPEAMRRMREQMVEALGARRRLTITQGDRAMTFTDGDGRSLTYRTDDRTEKHQLDSQTIETKTKWADGRLVRETTLEGGLKLTETFTLADIPRQLHVLVKLEGGRLPRAITLRRVYDPSDGR